MRTTLTLDDDLAAALKRLAARRRVSFKQTVNEVIRRGLSTQEVRQDPARRFVVHTFDSPFRAGVDPVRLNQLSDELEAQRAAAPKGRYRP